MILRTTDLRALDEFRALLSRLDNQNEKVKAFLDDAEKTLPPDPALDGNLYSRGVGILFGRVVGVLPMEEEEAKPPKGWRFATTHVLVPTRHSKEGRRLYAMMQDIPVVDPGEFQRKLGAPEYLEWEGEDYFSEFYAEYDGDNPRAVTALSQEWQNDDLKEIVLEAARASGIEWKLQ